MDPGATRAQVLGPEAEAHMTANTGSAVA
jgi:hypothetical protein